MNDFMDQWGYKILGVMVGVALNIWMDKIAKKKKARASALAVLEHMIEHACAEDLWESNGENDEMFKYQYKVWYQGQLATAWENYRLLL